MGTPEFGGRRDHMLILQVLHVNWKRDKDRSSTKFFAHSIPSTCPGKSIPYYIKPAARKMNDDLGVKWTRIPEFSMVVHNTNFLPTTPIYS